MHPALVGLQDEALVQRMVHLRALLPGARPPPLPPAAVRTHACLNYCSILRILSCLGSAPNREGVLQRGVAADTWRWWCRGGLAHPGEEEARLSAGPGAHPGSHACTWRLCAAGTTEACAAMSATGLCAVAGSDLRSAVCDTGSRLVQLLCLVAACLHVVIALASCILRMRSAAMATDIQRPLSIQNIEASMKW